LSSYGIFVPNYLGRIHHLIFHRKSLVILKGRSNILRGSPRDITDRNPIVDEYLVGVRGNIIDSFG
jgi:hypothetical protein